MKPSKIEWSNRQAIINRMRDKGSKLNVALIENDASTAEISELVSSLSNELKGLLDEAPINHAEMDKSLVDISTTHINSNELTDPHHLLKALAADELRVMLHAYTQNQSSLSGLLKDFENNAKHPFKEPRTMSLFMQKSAVDEELRKVLTPALTQLNSIDGINVFNDKAASMVKAQLNHKSSVNSPKSSYELVNSVNYDVQRDKYRHPFKDIEGKEIKFERNDLSQG